MKILFDDKAIKNDKVYKQVEAQEAIDVAKNVITLVSKEVWKKPIKW